MSKLDPGLGRLGNFLYYGGLLLFPAALGSVVGFYAADQGVHWLPNFIGGVLALSVLSMVMVMLGRWLRGRLFSLSENGQVLSRRFLLAMVLAILGLGMRLWVHQSQDTSPLTDLESAAFEEAWRTDLGRYEEYERGMELTLLELEAHPMFREGDRVLSADEEALLLQAWRQLYDYSFGLDQVRQFYEDWYRFDPSRAQRSYHLRSFLLMYLSELALYEKSTRFARLILQNRDAQRYLDSAHPELGMGEDSFASYRAQLHGTEPTSRILALKRYRDFLLGPLHARRDTDAVGLSWTWERIEAHRATINSVAPLQRGELSLRGDVRLVQRKLRHTWYPAQSGVAEWFGDTRRRRIGWYLITPEQVAEIDPELNPGDVLVSRKNWYLSNVGLPGFWPHALIYLGEPDKLVAFFDDPEVDAWVLEQTGQDIGFDAYMAQAHPQAWRAYVLGDGSVHPYRVIEATSEGIGFSTLEHAAGDYLGAMRPRLDKVALAQSVDAAFSHYAKPYDYDFDFATDHTLVCTELVWRALRPGEGKDGVDWEMVQVAGRRTLPANDLVAQAAQAVGTPEQQLDFVLFLDARERQDVAVRSTEAAFWESWQRVKWDMAQE
ncbi:MAG: YiiX/YebB-like N1pC/P60 family cysteine hydrolase [Myxococcota bacterium]|nr:YiiX/YebB-like N1pC/P60 family cysteine hydrolase [Myxococcota bacterium]